LGYRANDYIGLSGNKLSDYWAIGLTTILDYQVTNYRTIGLLDYRANDYIGLSGNKLLDYWAIGLSG